MELEFISDFVEKERRSQLDVVDYLEFMKSERAAKFETDDDYAKVPSKRK